MSGSEIAVKVENVSKTFHIPLEASNGLKQKLINTLKGRKGYREFTPLNDISFEINKGDFFGIVGRNGSGKSTLLKTIAGIYSPTLGTKHVNGTLVPFIELGVGFNPELTGRENVFLNGALLGFSHSEMESMYEEIVNFAELADFMEERLKNYSSGMQVRLAFSIAIKAESDILLLDEVLAVGDEAFQRKCFEYFEDLKRNNKTVILVTHDMAAVERFCNKAILIEKGHIIKSGSVSEVTSSYRDLLNPNVKHQTIEHVADVDEVQKRWGDHSYQFDKVTVSGDGRVSYGEYLTLAAELYCKNEKYDDLVIAFAIKDNTGQVLFGDKHKISGKQIPRLSEKKHVSFKFMNILSTGKYLVDLSVFSPRDNTYSDIWIDCASIDITNRDGTGFTVIASSDLLIR